MRRLAPLILVAAVVVPAAASTGKGPAAEPTEVAAIPPAPRFGEGGGVIVMGSDAANDVGVEIDSGRYLVHDPVGAVPAVVVTGYNCDAVDSTTVSCPAYGREVGILLDGGDDSLTVGSGVTGLIVGTANAGADRVVVPRGYPGNVRVNGGPGADVLAGGTQDDWLRGEAGSDVLRGKAGNDKLTGEAGRDSAAGGDGDDRLLMHANDRDRAIDCGSGDDRANIDPALDPEPRGCERIKTTR